MRYPLAASQKSPFHPGGPGERAAARCFGHAPIHRHVTQVQGRRIAYAPPGWTVLTDHLRRLDYHDALIEGWPAFFPGTLN